MLSQDEFKLMINEIIYEINIIDGKLKTIRIDKLLNAIGFPTNFKDICYMDKEF